MVDHGFVTLKLHRVWASCVTDNEPSWRLMERLRMRREGVLVQNTRLRDRWVDSYLYAILEDEWTRP